MPEKSVLEILAFGIAGCRTECCHVDIDDGSLKAMVAEFELAPLWPQGHTLLGKAFPLD